jgi:plasmid stabilization system protein ParE
MAATSLKLPESLKLRIERLFDFLAEHNPKPARERRVSVRQAFEFLADHPRSGGRAGLLMKVPAADRC